MSRIANNLLMTCSLVCLLVAFWNRNALPQAVDAVAALLEEPQQTPSNRQAFDVQFNDVTYAVEPEYAYDITGLVVSFRHHDDNSRMHRLTNDHLNMLDVCVVWGNNVTTAQLPDLDFWNGIFTCNVQTRNQAAWDSFNLRQLSNNHLLADDERIRERVRDVRIGDQIRIRGHLAGYSSPGVAKRGTSTTRDDTGDGACETIYVEQFEIVRPSRSAWRPVMLISLALLLVGLATHFLRPYRPHQA